MSRRRYLSTDAGRDKALRDVARASMFAHSFYLLAIPCAADDCTLPTNDPDELLWEVWPSMASDYSAADVEAAVDLLVANRLWEYAPDGRLRYPPGSYYKHQTYIREDRRGAAKGSQPAEAPRTAPETAHDSLSIEGTAQNSAEQRTSAQKGASFSSSFSVSSSLSPTTPVESRATDKPATRPPKGHPKPNKVALFVDAMTAEGMAKGTDYDLSQRDTTILKGTSYPIADVAACFAAVTRQEWGDTWLKGHPSLDQVLKYVGRFKAGAPMSDRQNGAATSATSRIDAVFERARNEQATSGASGGDGGRLGVGIQEARGRVPRQLPS